eukprot:jgi/Ulvmu1/9503/UM052_0076.1
MLNLNSQILTVLISAACALSFTASAEGRAALAVSHDAVHIASATRFPRGAASVTGADTAGTEVSATRHLTWAAWRRKVANGDDKEAEEEDSGVVDAGIGGGGVGYGDDEDDDAVDPGTPVDDNLQAAVTAACCDGIFTAFVRCPGNFAARSADGCPNLREFIVCCAA